MKKPATVNMRVLCATDLHQSPLHYEALRQAVAEHKPAVVAMVGDFLHGLDEADGELLPVPECAQLLAGLTADHVVFVRGNHEDHKWVEFAAAWPSPKRKLVTLYGSAYTAGPLTMIGFPCLTGSEFHWCNQLEVPELPGDTEAWLPAVLAKTGPAGRTLWLMHECPVGLPISHPGDLNPAWTDAVDKYSPRLTISGHDHDTPRGNNTWHYRNGDTVCVNAGQAKRTFHFVLIDLEFPTATPSLPARIKVRAYPWNKEITF